MYLFMYPLEGHKLWFICDFFFLAPSKNQFMFPLKMLVFVCFFVAHFVFRIKCHFHVTACLYRLYLIKYAGLLKYI